MTNAQLAAIVANIEKLEEDRRGAGADIRAAYKDAKSKGFNVKALQRIVRERKQDVVERAEIETGGLDVIGNVVAAHQHLNAFDEVVISWPIDGLRHDRVGEKVSSARLDLSSTGMWGSMRACHRHYQANLGHCKNRSALGRAQRGCLDVGKPSVVAIQLFCDLVGVDRQHVSCSPPPLHVPNAGPSRDRSTLR